MKILVVEDDPVLLKLICDYQKMEKSICETARNYKEGLSKINRHKYECVVLDLNLPDGDGIKLLDILKTDQPDCPVVIISARDTVGERVTGLEAGADDYLIKPFHLSELNARIKAVLRRRSKFTEQELKFGKLTINPDKRKVSVDEEEVTLTKKQYDILLYMVRNKNRIITKNSLADYLWADQVNDDVSYELVYTHVKNLRKKLSGYGCKDKIKTVYGIGYKFIDP